MPIGLYPTFNACVKANQDKRNPEAFCADLERKIKQQMAEANYQILDNAPLRSFFEALSEPIPVPSSPQNDLILSNKVASIENFLFPNRKTAVPLQLGDRVQSDLRMPPGMQGFGGYIIAEVSLTQGVFVLWDNAHITWDGIETLEPQSLGVAASEMSKIFSNFLDKI